MGIVIRCDVEVALLVKGSIGYDDVAVGIETEEVAECLDGAGTARHRVACTERRRSVLFQRLPGDTA